MKINKNRNKNKSKKKKQVQLINISNWKFKKFHFFFNKKNINYTNYFLYKKHINITYGIKFIETGFLFWRQFKSIKDSIHKFIKGFTSMRVYIKCNKLYRKKRIGVRMGKGKGSVLHWIYKIKRGTILLEVSDFYSVIEIFWSIKSKSPLKIKIVKFLI